MRLYAQDDAQPNGYFCVSNSPTFSDFRSRNEIRRQVEFGVAPRSPVLVRE
jgi:hypothetical protein